MARRDPTTWMVDQARDHPGRMIWLGFVPAMIVTMINTYTAIRHSVWMAVLMIPLLIGTILVIYMIGKLAQLNRDLDRRDRT